MLGSLIAKSRWCWTIWGKHPSARDYLNRGLTTRVEQAFSNWIQKGYNQIGVKESDVGRPCAWRFWTRATGNHAIACGILRNSCDRLGRPYPLLIMGTGKLKGWERHWEYLPVGLAPTWRRMEQLSTARAERFDELEQTLSQFQPPNPNWEELHKGYSTVGNTTQNSLPETKRLKMDYWAQADEVAAEKHQVLPLRGDPIQTAMQWHQRNKAQGCEIPTALFMGGAMEEPLLAVYCRALSSSDFIHLWCLGRSNQ